MNQGFEKSMIPPPTNTMRASAGLNTQTNMQNSENAVTCQSCFTGVSMSDLGEFDKSSQGGL